MKKFLFLHYINLIKLYQVSQKKIIFLYFYFEEIYNFFLGNHPPFASIDAANIPIDNKTDLQNYLIEQELEGGGAFFGFQVFPDLKNSKKMAAYLGSGGIGLPERDYYIKTDPKSKETREKYKDHVARMLGLIGLDVERKEIGRTDTGA